MKVLLDESLPVRLRVHLTGHDAQTVAYNRWSGIRNGRLLSLAAAAGFAAFITPDQAIEFEQNLSTLPLSVIIVHGRTNSIDDMLPLVPALMQTLNHLSPRSLVHIHP